jgi:hypothetical protein
MGIASFSRSFSQGNALSSFGASVRFLYRKKRLDKTIFVSWKGRYGMRRLTSCLFVGLPDCGFPSLTDLAHSFALGLVFAELAAETNFS